VRSIPDTIPDRTPRRLLRRVPDAARRPRCRHSERRWAGVCYPCPRFPGHSALWSLIAVCAPRRGRHARATRVRS